MHRTKVTNLIGGRYASGLFAAILIITLAGCQQAEFHQQQFLQFGTVIDVSLVADDETSINQLFNNIEQLLQQRHQQWHAWEKGTLQSFNQSLARHPMSGIEIPSELKQLIQLSKEYYDLTNGLFNPALGKLVSAWGFHRQQPPDKQLIAQIQQDIPDMWDLLIENNRAISINPYLQLDFGALAKGTVVKQIAQLLENNGQNNFIINAGGDIYAQGQKYERDWRVGIENPFAEGIIASLELASAQSIFTSGNYRRFYLDDQQQRRHHILNPLTGEPSTDISAATVIHQDPEIADIAATTLMLTHKEQLKNMAEKLGIQDFLVITEQKKAYISQTMLNKIHWNNSLDLKIHVL